MSEMKEDLINTWLQLPLEGNNCITPEKFTHSTPVMNQTHVVAPIGRLISFDTPSPLIVITSPADMNPHTLKEFQAVIEKLTAKEEEVQKLNEINKQLRERLEDCEAQLTDLTEQNNEHIKKERFLSQLVTQKINNYKQTCAAIAKQYEPKILSLVTSKEADTERWTEERTKLVREREELEGYLVATEDCFNFLHARYERCKSIIKSFKNNEEILKKAVQENNKTIEKLNERYETLREHAYEQINKANLEINSVKKSHELEILKLNIKLKKNEIHTSSLEESLAQKIKANLDLTAICDELINMLA